MQRSVSLFYISLFCILCAFYVFAKYSKAKFPAEVDLQRDLLQFLFVVLHDNMTKLIYVFIKMYRYMSINTYIHIFINMRYKFLINSINQFP